jgi:hypothetical protein
VSFDLQYVQYQDLVSVKRVGLIRGYYPAVIDVYGTDFSSVSSVLFNGREAKEYLVLSKTRLVAQLPESIAGAPLREVMVLSQGFTATDRSLLRFRMSRGNRLTKGMPKLVQTYVKLLLTSPGSDIYDREAGGGLLQVLRARGGKDDRGMYASAFATCVSRAQEQLSRTQSLDQSLPLNEKLMAAQLLSVDFDSETLTVSGRIRLTSMAGQEGLANLAMDSKEAA